MRHCRAVGSLCLMGVLALASRLIMPAEATNSARVSPAAARSNWTSIAYGDLVDRSAMVRTGQTLGEVLTPGRISSSSRGAVQPYLDPFSYLLPEAVEMIAGPSMAPYRNVAELFPDGSAQPAWVAVLRGGRVLVQSDGDRGVRIFVPGESPRVAYREKYSLLRHVLAGLAANSRRNLRISVYAYRHDYPRSEFRLNTTPYRLEASAFSPPTGLCALDLDGLEAFFMTGAPIAGATVDADRGFSIVPVPGALSAASASPLAGGSCTLADLAVAYRAIFHAGDNAAFISLDPNADPSLASVNFGGFLENTKIGSTVLEADKRFKTIGSGLDPDDHTDYRERVRARHPGFLTVAERDLAGGKFSGNRWIGTRFWFYPEAVDIESDADYTTAVIRRARFVADAERQRGDFATPAEFERFKRELLSPSIRAAIDDLNANYDLYAGVFPELRELETVARLLGICAWLRRAGATGLDLDALLSVELPAWSTPRARPQMITANWVIFSDTAGRSPDLNFTRAHMVTHYLTPDLDIPIAVFFPDANALAAFMSTCDAEDPLRRRARPASELLGAATEILAKRGTEPLKRLIRNNSDLQAFSRVSAARRSPAPRLIRELEGAITARRSEISSLESEIARVSGVLNERAARMTTIRARLSAMESTAHAGGSFESSAYDSLVAAHNRMVDEADDLAVARRDLVQRYDGTIDSANALVRMGQSIQGFHLLSIGGGINLGADDFKISIRPGSRRTARSGRAVVARDSVARSPRPSVTARPAFARPIGSPRPDSVLAAFPNRVPNPMWYESAPNALARRDGTVRRRLASTAPAASAPGAPRTASHPIAGSPAPARVTREGYWFASADSGSVWRDELVTAGALRERVFDRRTKQLHLREVDAVGREKVVTARRTASGRIVFTRTKSTATAAETVPRREAAAAPEWW